MNCLRYLLLTALLAMLQGCFPLLSERYGLGQTQAVERRTTGIIAADERIEGDIIARINKQYSSTVHVSVTSFNRHVLLTGEAPDEAVLSEIVRAAAGSPEVGTVVNELVIGQPTGVITRAADNAIASDVRMRFLNNGVFLPTQVKVIAENGTVFLMGLVYRKEADAAADIASTTQGVQRVIKVFEYLD